MKRDNMIRVLICDDQDVVREGLRTILSTVPGIEVVALAEDGLRAVELFDRHKPGRDTVAERARADADGVFCNNRRLFFISRGFGRSLRRWRRSLGADTKNVY